MSRPFDRSAFSKLGYTDWTVYDERRCTVGESPLWDHEARRLYWVDVTQQQVLFRGDATGSWAFDAAVAGVALAQEGQVVVASGPELLLLDVATGDRHRLTRVDDDKPGFRINELKVDREGRLWAGSFSPTTWAPEGRIYVFDAAGKASPRIEQVCVPNGMAWSRDGTRMYLTDSPKAAIDMFDSGGKTTDLRNRRMFARIAEGIGDGAAVDEEDHLWCATPGGWCVTRYTPDGQIERVLRLPVRFPTACTFGGPDLDTLFVTSATRPLTGEELVQQPAAGRVLALKTGFKGIPEPRAVLSA